MSHMFRAASTLAATTVLAGSLSAVPAHADHDNNTLGPNNSRLNDSLAQGVYILQHQAGCTNDVNLNPQLNQAAQWHADDLMNNRALDSDIGTDGSTPQDRANAAGFPGTVAETVTINPAISISSMELINRLHDDPNSLAIIKDCSHSVMGVWSENSLDRTVVVALYGHPTRQVPLISPNDPNPDYDASDELDYGMHWFPWILRGVYPPPANPPQ
ncbi:CAP domain-containing protein [Mycobacterium sp. JS623]|uniref:CAP domain-containing protein n=1 Tax=Mycobacterium sp. JS623 TaxID=212767 RepID=UPI003FA5318A